MVIMQMVLWPQEPARIMDNGVDHPQIAKKVIEFSLFWIRKITQIPLDCLLKIHVFSNYFVKFYLFRELNLQWGIYKVYHRLLYQCIKYLNILDSDFDASP